LSYERCDGAGQDWTVLCRDGSGELPAAVAGGGAQIVAAREPTLDELYAAV